MSLTVFCWNINRKNTLTSVPLTSLRHKEILFSSNDCQNDERQINNVFLIFFFFCSNFKCIRYVIYINDTLHIFVDGIFKRKRFQKLFINILLMHFDDFDSSCYFRCDGAIYKCHFV